MAGVSVCVVSNCTTIQITVSLSDRIEATDEKEFSSRYICGGFRKNVNADRPQTLSTQNSNDTKVLGKRVRVLVVSQKEQQIKKKFKKTLNNTLTK